MNDNQRPDLHPPTTKKLKAFSRSFRAFLAAAAVLAWGCGGDGNKAPTAREGQEVFANRPANRLTDREGAGQTAGGDAAAPATARSGWAVVVCTFNGKDAQKNAATGLARARRDAGLSDAYLETRSDGVAVLYGEFEDPASKSAKEALVRVRTAKIGNTMPFDGAILVPPPVALASAVSPYDLRSVRRKFDEKYKERKIKPMLVTLQVAFYGPPVGSKATAADTAEARKAAEQAVAKLRAEGEEAYFFHGARGSNVTLGLFENDEVDGPVMSGLRKKYPNLLVNGAGVKMTTQVSSTQKRDQMQPSVPVEVPK